MINRLIRLSPAALAGFMFWPWLALAAPEINVLVSEPAGIYQETAASLSQTLSRDGWKITLSTPERPSTNGRNLTVAIGTRALEAALSRPARPILSLLVPQLTYERLSFGQHQVSALYLDQPLTRQLRLLGLALPGLKKAGATLGPASRGLQAELRSAAKASGIQVNSAVIDQGSDLYAALTELAEDSQAFLLLPDPVVVQRGSLQNFFLHTYRLKKPVLAYSAPLVKSGALLGLYATPAQLGGEAAGWISESWSGGAFHLGAPRYPKRFTIGINRTVARSLEIDLPSEEALGRRLEAMP
ncbi:MAG: ABC transporter substrate-binding protein [Thiobacillus sp.]